VAHMLIKADVVVGEDVAETTVDDTFYLEYPATKIAEIQARITELECEVMDGQAIITGTVHKQIFYVGPESRVFHQSEDVPFSAVAVVPGAEPGMHCQVDTTVQNVEGHLVGPLPSQELRQRVILVFFVKVTIAQQLRVILGTTGPLYKVQRVVAEDTTGTVVESTVELPMPCEKVRAVHAVAEDVSASTADGQVIVEGIIHKQIFYISAFDEMEYHDAEDVPFTAVVPIEGVQAGEDVDVDVNVIRTTWTLDGAELNQRVVLSIFCKVSETAQTMLRTDPHGPLIKVGRVIGENMKQIMVEDQICLDVPTLKVQDILAYVTDIQTEVIKGKVLIDGTIHKQIFYVGPNDVVRHQGEDVPFSAVVDIYGAEPGMTAQVHPTIEHVGWTLIHETPSCPLPPYYDGPYGHMYMVVEQRVALSLFVKLTETVQINVCLDTPQG